MKNPIELLRGYLAGGKPEKELDLLDIALQCIRQLQIRLAEETSLRVKAEQAGYRVQYLRLSDMHAALANAHSNVLKESAALRDQLAQIPAAVEALSSVLCGSHGACEIHGSQADRDIVDSAISSLNKLCTPQAPKEEPFTPRELVLMNEGYRHAQKEKCTDERMCPACFSAQGVCDNATPQASEPARETNSMGIPLSCGGPLCGPKHHHPLCKLFVAPQAPVEPVAHQGRWFDLSDAKEGWSDWRDIDPIDLPRWQERVSKFPDAYEIRGLCVVPLAAPQAPATNRLPERDLSKPAEAQGLFRKFIVTRTDGSSAPGGKHHGCEYFVLDVDHDPHAKAALQAYAVACEETHPELSNDLRGRHGWNYDKQTVQSLRSQIAMMKAAKDGCQVVGVLNTSEIVEYVAQYGGGCRDCADENGVCPSSGLPCGGYRKAIEHVLSAVDYGLQHKFITAPQAPALPPEAQVCCEDYANCGRPCTPRGRWLATQAPAPTKQDNPHNVERPNEVADYGHDNSVSSAFQTPYDCAKCGNPMGNTDLPKNVPLRKYAVCYSCQESANPPTTPQAPTGEAK